MADISIGDLITRLRADTTDFMRGMQQAQAALVQFQQASAQTVQQMQSFGQAFQQPVQQMQALTPATTQATQAFQQFNQTMTATTAATRQGVQAAQSFGSAWQTVTQIAAGIGLATSIQGLIRGFINFASESVQLAARMEDLARSFRTIEGSASAAQRTLGEVFAVAQRAGVGFEEVARGLQRLEAGSRGTTLTLDQVKRAFEGIVIGGRAMGISTQQSEHALVAWEQILTKGRLSAEELVRQLGNAIPGGLSILAQGLGTTSARLRDMAEANLPITTAAFVAFGEVMRSIGEQGGGIEGLSATFNRLHNETKAWMDALGGWLSTVLLPILNKVLEISEDIRRLYGIGSPGTGAPQAGAAGAGAAGTAAQAPQTFVGQIAQYLPTIYQHLPFAFPAFGPFGRPTEPAALPPAPTAATAFPIAESRYTTQIAQAAGAQQIDPGLLSQLIRTESNFNPYRPSPAGAQGLGQLLPSTAQTLQPGITREQLLEPQKNLELAARYLAQMLETFKDTGDQVRLALTAYQSGPGKVKELLARAGAQNLPQTLAGISQIPQAQGGLGPEGRAYAGRVLETGTGQTVTPEGLQKATAAAAQAQADSVAKTLEDFGRIKGQIDDARKSGENFNNVLGKDLNQQVDKLVGSLTGIVGASSRFPEIFKNIPPEIMKATEEALKQAVIWKETTMTDERRLALLKQQVEATEQLNIQRQAQVVRAREGPEAAERYTRQATEALQEQRLAERPKLAALTLKQQIDEQAARLSQLQDRATYLGGQIEEQAVAARRPAFEQELSRIEATLGRVGTPAAEQAASQARQQIEQLRPVIENMLREVGQHPGLQQFAERLKAALAGLGEAAAEQSQIAYDRVEKQTLDRVSQIGGQIEVIAEKLGTAGLDPLAQALGRVHREFEALTNQLEEFLRTLDTMAKTATPAGREAIEAAQARAREQLAQVKTGEPEEAERARVSINALRPEAQRQEAQIEANQASVQDLRNRLEDLRAQPVLAGPGPFGLTAGPQTRQERQTLEQLTSPESRAQAAATQQQIKEQEQLNYQIQLTEQFAGSVGSAWTNALTSIASGTQTVSEAFRQMAQSIIQSMIQIASQEAFKGILRLGIGLLVGGATGGLTGGGGGGSGPEVPADIASSGALGASSQGIFSGALGFQHGGVVNSPQFGMIGENPANNPEYILNRHQMASMMDAARGAGPSAGGQAISIINVSSKEEASRQKLQQEALGRKVVLNHVMSDLAQGESSSINRAIRGLAR